MKITKPTLKKIFFLINILFMFGILNAQKDSKQFFVNAKNEIDSMLSGKTPLNYERAVFIIENAYHNNEFRYADYKNDLDNYQKFIEYLKNTYSKTHALQPKKNILISKDSADKNCDQLATNYAIYKLLTDTVRLIGDSVDYFHVPYGYSYNDPFATKDWGHSQVLNLLYSYNPEGNCLALTTLFKILSLRFNSNVNIATTQGHIFITHANENGRTYNIELASKSFPGTGSIEILTHTSDKSVRSGIAMRELNLKQSIGLCLINLAKSYERKFGSKTDLFLLDCANLTLKYDSLNLNAMLLKTEILEANLLSQSKPFNQLKITKEFLMYQNYIKHLHGLGYREMPLDMKNKLVSALTKDTSYVSFFKDNTYNPFAGIDKNYNRTFSMSNGLFEEFDIEKPTQQYFRTVFDTKTKKIIAFKSIDTLYNRYEIDPVVFAWNIDPQASKYAAWSPYTAFIDNPIRFVDPDGADIVDAQGRQIAVINEKTGKVEFTEFATEKVKAVLGVVNSTEIGNTVLTNAITAKHNIEFSLSPKAVIDGAVTSKPTSGKPIRFGDTDSEVTPDGKDFSSSKVTIYEGSIKFAQKEGMELKIGGKKIDVSKYSLQQVEAATAIHELTHATDKNSNSKINPTGTHENNPQSNEGCFINEIDTKAKTDDTEKK